MYSHVGIIIGAVVSAILGFYVFVPDGSLRMFDYWLSIWQPIVWDAPVVIHQKEELARYMEEAALRLAHIEDIVKELEASSGILDPVISPQIPPRVDPYPLPLPIDAPVVIHQTPFEEELARYVEEAALEVAHIQYEDIFKELEASSGILDPVISPQIPPQVDPYPLPFPISSLWVVAGVLFSLWPYFISCLPIIALARKTWDMRKLQHRQHEEKEDISEQLRQTIKENLEMAKAHEEQAQKILALDATTKILEESYKDLEAEHFNVKSEKKDLETQIKSLKRNAELGERREPQEAKKDQKDPIVEGGSSAPNLTTKGTATPYLGTAKDADKASGDDAEEPKKAGKKKRRRRRRRYPGAGELGREQEEETHEKK